MVRILTVLAATPTYAVESAFLCRTSRFEQSLYLIGGQYDFYVDAKRPVVPTQEAMSLG